MRINIKSTIQDQAPEDFEGCVRYLIENYTARELAGAFLNATDGGTFYLLINAGKDQ